MYVILARANQIKNFLRSIDFTSDFKHSLTYCLSISKRYPLCLLALKEISAIVFYMRE